MWEVSIQFWDISQCYFSPSKSTSGGQTHDHKAAVQRTVYLERSTFICFSALMVHTHHTLTYASHSTSPHTLTHPLCTQLHQTQPNTCPLEVKPHPLKIFLSVPQHYITTLGHISPNSPRNSGKYPPDSSETWPTILSCSRGPQRNVPCE